MGHLLYCNMFVLCVAATATGQNKCCEEFKICSTLVTILGKTVGVSFLKKCILNTEVGILFFSLQKSSPLPSGNSFAARVHWRGYTAGWLYLTSSPQRVHTPSHVSSTYLPSVTSPWNTCSCCQISCWLHPFPVSHVNDHQMDL